MYRLQTYTNNNKNLSGYIGPFLEKMGAWLKNISRKTMVRGIRTTTKPKTFLFCNQHLCAIMIDLPITNIS